MRPRSFPSFTSPWRVLKLLISSPNLRQRTNPRKPLLDERAVLQAQSRKLMLLNPGLKMQIHCSDSRSSQNRLAAAPPQLLLKRTVEAKRLPPVPVQSVLILRRVVVLVPVHLARHGSQRREQELLPLFKVDDILLAAAFRAQQSVLVVHPTEVIHDCAALPTYDAGVWVFEGRDAAVFVDFEKRGAEDSFLRVVAEFPHFYVVRDFEEFEGHGDFEGVGSGLVGVEEERFDGLLRHVLLADNEVLVFSSLLLGE